MSIDQQMCSLYRTVPTEGEQSCEQKEEQRFFRSQLLLGGTGMARLAAAQVAVCGLGGVGSYIAESVARSGVGALILIDFDRVDVSNINRQLCALSSTVGQYKVDVIARRLRDINPACFIRTEQVYISSDNVNDLLQGADYVLDAVDNVQAKLALIQHARQHGLGLVSAMGAGKRLDPTRLRLADISETHTCPLARILRRELKALGITKGVRVAFSEESPLPDVQNIHLGSRVIGSSSFVPPAMGLLMASLAIRELAGVMNTES